MARYGYLKVFLSPLNFEITRVDCSSAFCVKDVIYHNYMQVTKELCKNNNVLIIWWLPCEFWWLLCEVCWLPCEVWLLPFEVYHDASCLEFHGIDKWNDRRKYFNYNNSLNSLSASHCALFMTRVLTPRSTNLHHLGCAMRKRVFGHMRTAMAQIRLCIRAVWSRPSLSAYRITESCRTLRNIAKFLIGLYISAG